MKVKDKYFMAEILLTFTALSIIVFLFGRILSIYKLYLTGGLIAGFLFSWLRKDKPDYLAHIFVNICIFLTVIWVVYAFFNSSFFYREVALICVEGLFLTEVILSFNAGAPFIISYIQALSIPIFMAYPVLIKGHNALSGILIAAYLLLWLIALKVNFAKSFMMSDEEPAKKIFSQGRFISHIIVYFVLGLACAWVFFYVLPIGNIKRGGLFLEQETAEVGMANLEQEYYNLQDKIQKEINKEIPLFPSIEEQRKILDLLTFLIKESPDTQEVQAAEKGLISSLKLPGPGLEEGRGSGLTLLINEYINKKISLNLKRAKDKITEALKRKPFDIKMRIMGIRGANKIMRSSSSVQLEKNEKEFRRNINGARINRDIKEETNKQITRLKDWKDFEIYRNSPDYWAEKPVEATESAKEETKTEDSALAAEAKMEEVPLKPIEERKLVSIIVRPQNPKIPIEGKISLKAEGYFTDSSQQDLTSLAKWSAVKQHLIKISAGKIQAIGIGRTEVYAEYMGIKSIPANIRVVITVAWLMKLIFKIFIFSSLLIMALFSALYFLVTLEKNKLLQIYKDPRQFIISLYNNLKSTVSIFGLSCEKNLTPLSYAKLLEGRFPSEDKLFLKCTAKFMEAKYSRHNFKTDDSLLFLQDYNAFLKVLFSRHGKFFLLARRCRAMFYIRPIFINANLPVENLR